MDRQNKLTPPCRLFRLFMPVSGILFAFLPSAAMGSEDLVSGAKNERQVVLYTAMVQGDTNGDRQQKYMN